jgi:hypothetical protein
MKFDENFFYGLVFGIVLVVMYTMYFSRKTSTFDVKDFPDSMSSGDAEASYKTQTSGIATELSQKLTSALGANASKDDLIKLTWSYADMSNQLNKNYSAYKIRTMSTPTPGAQQQVQTPAAPKS